ncbi:LOB domain-containing protein 27 [Striga hermonthica]|uniref:LOB domain-containing protein 27 n=1 Tax=Striga hermonthica TaxID=68872 RepID=A0A9N7N8K5_STRHE|nr:LOB domain-containing protein 27 [Striga hermonthica]
MDAPTTISASELDLFLSQPDFREAIAAILGKNKKIQKDKVASKVLEEGEILADQIEKSTTEFRVGSLPVTLRQDPLSPDKSANPPMPDPLLTNGGVDFGSQLHGQVDGASDSPQLTCHAYGPDLARLESGLSYFGPLNSPQTTLNQRPNFHQPGPALLNSHSFNQQFGPSPTLAQHALHSQPIPSIHHSQPNSQPATKFKQQDSVQPIPSPTNNHEENANLDSRESIRLVQEEGVAIVGPITSAADCTPVHTPMTVKGGSTPACAVCKYQRRRCSPNCPLAPYFPANQPKMFQNVHRLFGVSNITKILESLDDPIHKDDAMKSIIFEAEMRHNFPVQGCCVILSQLRFQLQCALEELHHLNSKIADCKEQLSSNSNNNSNYHHQSMMSFDCGPSDMCRSFQIQPMENYEIGPSGFVPDEIYDCNGTSTVQSIQAQMDAFGIQQDQKNNVYYPDFEGMVDRDCWTKTQFESRANCIVGMSSESSKRETKAAQNICESELKTAAAGLTLTMNRTSNS